MGLGCVSFGKLCCAHTQNARETEWQFRMFGMQSLLKGTQQRGRGQIWQRRRGWRMHNEQL